MSAADLRAQWRRLAAGDRPAYLYLPKNPYDAHQAMLEHAAQHPRVGSIMPPADRHGETYSGWTRDILHALTTGDNPGFSVHDHLGDGPKHGYMVSVDPHDEEVVPLRAVQMTPDYIGEYLDTHEPSLRGPDSYFGGWAHNGKVFFDTSIHTDSADEARKLAIEHNQKAYYDIDTGQSIMINRRVAALVSEARDFGVTIPGLPSSDYQVLDPRPLSPGYEKEDYSFDFIHPQIATGGALHTIADAVTLKRFGIQAVIDCRADFDDGPLFHQVGFQYLWDPTVDDASSKSIEWFKKGLDFGMPFLRSGEKVYAHCHSGRNRGPSMAYTLLRAHTGCSHQTAMSAIHAVRPFAPVRYADDADAALVKLGYLQAT